MRNSYRVGRARLAFLFSVFLVFACLAPTLHADVTPTATPAARLALAAGPELGGGASLYQTVGGVLVDQASAVGWASYDAVLGSIGSDGVFASHYIIGPLVGVQKVTQDSHPIVGFHMGWFATGNVPLTMFAVWRLDGRPIGEQEAIYGVGSSFQFDVVPGLDFLHIF